MTNIDNMDKVIVEIKTLLQKNDNFRKLLKFNTPDALEQNAPDKTEIDDLIKTSPAVYMNEDPNAITLNSFCVVYLPVISFSSEMNELTYMVDVFTKKEVLDLNNKKLRLHQMVSEIYKSLDRRRVSMAGILEVKNASYIVIGTSYVGYQIEISIIDEAIENDL